MDRVIVHICTRDRPTEVFGLLQSLRTQSNQNFDILLLEDGSGTPLQSYYFIQHMIYRLKAEGHNVIFMRNEQPSGVSGARQKLVDYTMTELKHSLILRVDDDILLEADYIDRLLEGIEQGYDLVSGLTLPFFTMQAPRDIEQVKPIIGECQLNAQGELILNQDDCAIEYTEHTILPTHHFRSCALYKRELHEKGVDYHSRLSRNGFREEQVLSFKAILKGFKLGVNTGAINYHLMTPSGGERDTMNMTGFNQEQFEFTTKVMFDEHGDFISDYNKRLGVVAKTKSTGELLKQTNLTYKKQDINLLEEVQ